MVWARCRPAPGLTTWLADSPNETGFEIYPQRQAGTSAFTRVAMVDMDRGMFRDYGADPAIAYRYAVAAVNGNGSSALVAQGGAAVMADPDPCAVGAVAGDSDGDGLADADELAGWTVFVDETGTGALESRTVTSDPLIGDTDGDALSDYQKIIVSGLHPAVADVPQLHRFRTITTLTLSDDYAGALAPGQATGTLRAEANIPANAALELLADPRGLFFEIASFRLLRSGPGLDQPVDNAFLEQVTNKQTALVQIDHGNNTVLRHRVATNVARENGSIVGVRLPEVLGAILELPYETATSSDPVYGEVTVLTSLRDPVRGTDVATDVPAQRVWMLIGTIGTSIAPGTSFDDVVLRGGDELHIMDVRDVDRDGLFARQEALHGSSDQDPDSDGDGVSDGVCDGISDTPNALCLPGDEDPRNGRDLVQPLARRPPDIHRLAGRHHHHPDPEQWQLLQLLCLPLLRPGPDPGPAPHLRDPRVDPPGHLHQVRGLDQRHRGRVARAPARYPPRTCPFGAPEESEVGAEPDPDPDPDTESKLGPETDAGSHAETTRGIWAEMQARAAAAR